MSSVLYFLSSFSLAVQAAPPGQSEDTETQAQTLLQEGLTLYERGDLSGALKKLQTALPLVRATGDQVNEATVLANIGVIYNAMEQPQAALTYIEQSLTLQRQLGSQIDESTTLGNIGSIYITLGQPREALTYLEQALIIHRQRGNQVGEADALSQVGAAYLDLGQLQEALTQLEQALTIQQQIGDQVGEAFTLYKMGLVYAALGQPQKALDYYQQALLIQRQVGDQLGEAAILSGMGAVYENFGQLQEGLAYFEQALTIQRQIGDRAGEGETLVGLGAIHHDLGQYERTLEYYQQALAIATAIDDRVGEGERLNSIGAVYSALGQFEQSLDYYQRALAIQRQVGDRLGEATTLNNMGAAYQALSGYPQALDYLQQALVAHNELGDRRGEAITTVNIGTIYYELAQPQEALAHFQRALPLFRQIGNRSGEANTLGHIGGVYQEILGQLPQALDYYQQALQIYREVGDRRGEAQQLNNVGYVYGHMGHPEHALEAYSHALTSLREIGDRWGEAIALDNIGGIYNRLNQPQQAITSYREALSLRQAIGDRAGEATTLNNLGTLYHLGLSQPQQGIDYFQRALPIAREIGDRQGEAITLDNIGVGYLDLGRQTEALTYFRQSIEIFEAIRSGMSIEELKSGFAARYAGHYQTIVSLLIELDRPEEAFAYSERARARAFLDQLGNARVDPDQGADPALIEAEQQLASDIATLDRRQRELLRQPRDPQTDQLLSDLQTRLTTKRAEYADLLIQLKLSNPAYADLISVVPLTLEQIQTEMLAENTTLVSYFVTADQTIAFVVGRDHFTAIPITVTRSNLVERVTAFRSLITLEAKTPTDRLAADRLAAAQALYALLFAPLAPYLPTASIDSEMSRTPQPSLIIVPHDVLHYLPFAALSDEAGTPLLARFTLSLAPSASTLNYAQTNQSPDQGRLLALGNPTTDLPSLPYAEHEVETLAKLYSQRITLSGSAATEIAFRAEVSNADWIHLAAHAQLNPTSPLFSALYLAAEPSAVARPDLQETSDSPENLAIANNDGRLEVHEILNLDLTGVNGVVLSACETGLGEQSRGDELVGLTRAFLYAGTPLVVASLWEVEDEATAALMAAFHQHLRAGLGPAAALRAAQAEIRQDPGWTAPYYWAGFQAIGVGGPAAEETSNIETITETTSPQVQRLDGTNFIWLSIGFTLLLVLFGLVSWTMRRRGQ